MTREDEIVGLLHHVTQQSTLVAEQICVVVEEWNSQYETKELRSHQRKTYFRLLQRLAMKNKDGIFCVEVSLLLMF